MNAMNHHGLLIDDAGRSTHRGRRLTKDVIPLLRRLFARCESAREARDLKHLLDGDVSVAHSLRVLGLMVRENKKKTQS